MTAKELYEKAISEPMYATYVRQEKQKHLKLAQEYYLGEKAYYEKVKFDIVEGLSDNDFFTAWANNGYKNIFEEPTVTNVFAWVDYFIEEDSKSERPELVAKYRKKVEERYCKKFSEFSGESTIYYWLQKQIDSLTDNYSDYFASRTALKEYEKVENQLMNKGYFDPQKGWIKNVVALQALIKKLYTHHYFNRKYTGAANPYKGLYPFIEQHFHITVNQNFEKARMERVEVQFYIRDIAIKPL